MTRQPPSTGSTQPTAQKSAVGTAQGPEIKVILDPPKKVFFLTADAQMPKIKARCQLPNPVPAHVPAVSGSTGSPAATAQSYDWDVTVVFNPAGVPHAAGRTTCHSPIRVTTVVPELALPFSQIRGGTLTVSVATTFQGKRITGKAVAEIRGTNPSATLIRAEGVSEILMKLMKLESSLQQFLTTHAKAGYPVFSHDGFGGVGLGQITHPRPTDDEVLDWKANVIAAKAQWDSKRWNDAQRLLQNYANSRAFRNLVEKYNQDRTTSITDNTTALPKKAGKPLPEPLKPLTITLPPITDEMIDNETLRLYNGAPVFKDDSLQEYSAETDEGGLLVVDVAQNGLHGTARWHQVTADERRTFYKNHTSKDKTYKDIGDPNYVNHVRSQVVN